MTIASLRLENFQNHLDTELALSPGVNVVVGDAENGKTAILRALKWLCLNHASLPVLRRVGARYCRVAMALSNGTSVIRERRGTTDNYTIRYELGHTNTYHLSTEGMIPPEIQKALNLQTYLTSNGVLLHPVFAHQFAGPFLLSEESPERTAAVQHFLGIKVLQNASVLGTAYPEAQELLQRTARRLFVERVAVLNRLVNLALEAVFGSSYRFSITVTEHKEQPRLNFSLSGPNGVCMSNDGLLISHGGGLSHLIGLGLRLGILAVAEPPTTIPLVLDEPSCHLSDRYVTQFARFLKMASQELGRQILVLTHNQRLTSAADTIYVLSNTCGVSTVHSRGCRKGVNPTVSTLYTGPRRNR